ncbi:transporter substrate-binding domain-containing protein [Paucibacter sp. TC2R-5]|uniref:substrate-binding periplasmic protein n=1 Tax=Paucibacter sp. TC2R-5 TaxID=2893555 RepID=UPI0021E4488A|nr:transporter substrate-binding domain-containing protein [Paucibacter sp. TC2R-5]MCV2358188.1 transporter substrate-binding domain-containing protein [Paucibacter sp. TC2R-5]
MPFRSSFADSSLPAKRRVMRRDCLRVLLLGAGCLGLWARALSQTAGIKVLMEELPPYSYTDAEGRPAGYALELAQELLARAKMPASFEFNSWARVLLRSSSEAQVLVPAIVRLAEREAQFHWLGQIATRRGTLFKLKSRSDIKLDRLDKFKAAGGLRIGVVKNDVSERELIALGLDTGQSLDRSADHISLLRRFFAGRTDLLALNASLAPALLKQFGFDPGQIEPVLQFSESRPSMALSLATDEATRQRLQQSWDAMRRDGTVAAIAARYPSITLE